MRNETAFQIEQASQSQIDTMQQGLRPAPPRKKYPFHLMEIGHKFKIPNGLPDLRKIAMSCNAYSKRHGVLIKVWRCWPTADIECVRLE